MIDRVVKKLSDISIKLNQEDSGAKNKIFIDTDLLSARLWEMVAVLALILIGSMICFCYGQKFVRNFGVATKKRG